MFVLEFSFRFKFILALTRKHIPSYQDELNFEKCFISIDVRKVFWSHDLFNNLTKHNYSKHDFRLASLKSPSSTAKPIKIDLGIVFGSSGKNAPVTFAAEKELAKKMIEKYDISSSATLIGAISYDNDARVEWRFGDVIDAKSTVDRINRLRRSRNGNNVLKALEIARDDLFSIMNGARKDVPKTLIVFIDKTGMRDQRLEDTAKQLKDKGVKVIVIAIGPEVDKTDVAGIASSPKDVISLPDPSKPTGDVISKAVAQSLPGK